MRLLNHWVSIILAFHSLTDPAEGITLRRDNNWSPHQHITRHDGPSLLSNATQDDIATARKVVQDAIAEMTKLNKARVNSPMRNNYSLKPGTQVENVKRDDVTETPLPLLNITSQIAQAAALVAEAEVATNPANQTTPSLEKRAGTFWLGNIDHKGSVPWGDDPTYKVFRDVVADYGADPTGATDSTAAINNAMTDGSRCGVGCNGSTLKNAIVYFPPGTYLVSSSISVLFGTQLIGDANNRPIIKAASSFVGLGVLSTDVYVGGTGPDGNDAEYYVNTARFYNQIRNVVIDITATDPGAYVCAIHYQVAQATSLQNVELIATTGTTQQGIYSENGSGGMLTDITFTGGNFGFYGGNQQFSAQRLTFNGCGTAVQVVWDWGWVWKSITVNGANVGFRLVNDGGTGNIGSASFIDSVFTDIATAAIVIGVPSSAEGAGSTGLVLDNVNLGGAIQDTTGKEYAAAGYYTSFVLGPTYDANGDRTWQSGTTDLAYDRRPALQGASVNGLDLDPYFERAKNQYIDKTAADFVHMKDYATGDGSTDDTAAVQQCFNDNADGSKIIYVDAGTYLLSDTVTIPKDAKIVGETWSQFAATGSAFADPTNPKVMLKVGSTGDVGTVEMQDLMLTTKGGTAGVILMEWNVQASTQGAAALWDVHARVGGATGTELTPDECPPITTGTDSVACQAASLLLHITSEASGYFENMWLWVADHILDDPDLTDAYNDMTQVSVYSARGFLIESTTATWLYGTAAEHSVYYQYNFNGAENIFTTMIQSESPYYQPTPEPPAPFTSVVGVFSSDPTYNCPGNSFSGCDESWAVIIRDSAYIHIGGAGTYSWFSTYSQDCIDTQACQDVLWLIDSNYDGVRIQHMITIGAQYMLVSDGTGVLASDNLDVNVHPFWSQISIFDAPTSGSPPVTTNPNDKCDPSDNTFSTEAMPAPQYMPWLLMDAENALISMWYHVTIVNLTPYTFIQSPDAPIPYQIPGWDWGDIPSGKARQNSVMYTDAPGKDAVDDNGEVYYSLEGTDKMFTVRITTHIPDDYPYRTVFDLTGMGLGSREYRNPEQNASVTLVITGSEEYGGYYTSLTFAEANWMHGIYDVIKDRPVKNVVMPGTHDSAMSKISSALEALGDAANTQTQGLNIYDQLRVGSRYFDMRIASVYDGSFWGIHVNDELDSTIVVGASGEPLTDIIDEINQFTSEYPGEVIFIWFRYLVYILGDTVDERYWDEDTWEAFYSAIEGINNRCPNLDSPLDDKPMSYFLDQNNGNGCVILIQGGDYDTSITGPVTLSVPDQGIYPTSFLPRSDDWADVGDTEPMADHETADWYQNRIAIDGAGDVFKISQWIVTPNLLDADDYGLQLIAITPTNPALYFDGVNTMDTISFPTVILQDYIGVVIQNALSYDSGDLSAEIQTLAIGLNLYLVGQNCDISSSKWALVATETSDSVLARRESHGPPKWTGTIFANGTHLDTPPTYHYGRPKTLKAGTRYRNGTVLTEDIPNPYYNATF